MASIYPNASLPHVDARLLQQARIFRALDEETLTQLAGTLARLAAANGAALSAGARAPA
jgi:hypothetical protein